MIITDIAEHKLNRIVVAACSPNLHEATFRGALQRAGLNPYFFQMVNIREHASWVHEDRAAATAKAKDQVRAAVARVQFHKPLERKRFAVEQSVLVVGGGIAGITASTSISWNASPRLGDTWQSTTRRSPRATVQPVS
jgi:heterodisulfide reductase subunit A